MFNKGWTNLICSALVACCMPGAPTARAQGNVEEVVDDDAKTHFQIGRGHYSRGDFTDAAEEFRKAYDISKRAELLYNLYLAYRDAGESVGAADALRRFLAEAEDVLNRGQLEARLRILEKSIEDQKSSAGAPPATIQAAPPPASQPGTQPAPQPPPAAEPATYDEGESGGSKILPFAVMGVGGAMVIGSIITGAMASSKQAELEDECPDKTGCDPSLRDTVDSGETLALVTDILLFGGIAVASAGVAILLLGGDDADSDAAAASFVCLPGACSGAVRVNF